VLNGAVSRARPAAAWPTAFSDLNELLAEVVARVEMTLGDNFVGAYITGSFALGAGDLHSDCDFVVVTNDPVTPAQERAIGQLHAEIPTRCGYWPHNLEGSYAPRTDLGTLAALGRTWLYVDRGSREMQWSTHCNTEDVRWTLRERGLTLAGPDPRAFVARVPADALRRGMPPLIDGFVRDLLGWTSFDVAWSQRYAVTTLCRMLFTLETGEVASKPASLDWAERVLPLAWHRLIQQVREDRTLGFDPGDRPRRGSVAATIAFAEYAKERAAARVKREP
jgi:Domain of unknown function (DUF4111)